MIQYCFVYNSQTKHSYILFIPSIITHKVISIKKQTIFIAHKEYSIIRVVLSYNAICRLAIRNINGIELYCYNIKSDSKIIKNGTNKTLFCM